MKTLYLLADLLRDLADRLDPRPLPPAAELEPYDRVHVRVLHAGGDVTDIHGVVSIIGVSAADHPVGYLVLQEEGA